ncbi:hypothetical protein SAMN06296386_110110, partial [Lachnospiraceae bacterium]
PEPEPAPAPAPVSDDPNHVMTPDEIAAMLASAGGDEPAPEPEIALEPEPEIALEPEPEPAPAPVSDDPNHVMTPEEIAAMLDSVGGDEPAPEPEPEIALEPEPEIALEPEPAPAPVSDDPNHVMTPEEIAAMLDSVGGDEPAPEPEPEIALEPEPEPEIALEPEPEIALEPEPEPALEPEPEIALEPEPEPEPAPADDIGIDADLAALMGSDDSTGGEEMSEDDIANLLNDVPELGDDLGEVKEAEPALEPELPLEPDLSSQEEDLLGELAASADKDVSDLLDENSHDEELSEINDLLKKNDNNEMVDEDILSILNDSDDDGGGEGEKPAAKPSGGASGDAGGDGEEDPKKKKKKKKKGGGFFSKLFGKKKGEEDEAEEGGAAPEIKIADSVAAESADEIPPDAEDILGALLEEGEGGKKKKKAGEGEKEEKKGFLAKLSLILFGEDDDDDDEFAGMSEATRENMKVIKEAEAAEKKKKKKKEPKPKKEKPKKEPKPKKEKKKKEPKPDDGPPEKKLPKKKVFAVVLFFVSLTAMIMFCLMVFPKAGYVNLGKSLYNKGDYNAAYETLAGVSGLDAESQLIYENAAFVMKLQRKYDSYTDFMAQGKSLDALDALVQGVNMYRSNLYTAQEKGVEQEYTAIYGTILSALSNTFGVSEEKAESWLALTDRIDYTIALMDVTDPEWRARIAAEIAAESGEIVETTEEPASTGQVPLSASVQPSDIEPVEQQEPDIVATEEAAPPSDAENGDIAAEIIDETPNEEENTDNSSNGNSGGGAKNGDLLYEFNVQRNNDGTYSSR